MPIYGDVADVSCRQCRHYISSNTCS